MIYTRRYVQYNDLVIDNYGMIGESSLDTPFKYTSTEYTFGHGSYSPNKQDYMFVGEAKVSLTLYLAMKKLSCEDRPHYRKFVIREISKPGKLWAVVNNELVWAYAKATNYAEVDSRKPDTIEINVDIALPEGIWHKADIQKTFLQPYDVCHALDCYGYQHTKGCNDGCCCCGEPVDNVDCICCDCSLITKDMALCSHLDDLQKVYRECEDGNFHIVYDCCKGQEFFGDDYLGKKLCTKDSCSNIIAGQVYANTDIPTTGITVMIKGRMLDPAITINGNTNIIEGDMTEFDGTLTISDDGTIYYRQDDCCADTVVSPANLTIPAGNDYGWTMHQGNNSVLIDTHQCCGYTCAYFQIDELTI